MSHSDIVRAFLRHKADALVRADTTFFEQALHPDFVYVNTRGVQLDKAGYISQFSAPGGVRFARQDVSDLTVTSIGEIAIGTMTLHDTFVRAGEQASFTFQSLCVFRIETSSCRWVAGQTMVPERRP